MKEDTFRFAASDDHELYCYRWQPDGAPRAIVLVSHGMGEHAGRYSIFGEPLAERGYSVLAHDQRGHGLSADDAGRGYLGADGWSRLLEDLAELHRHLLDRNPGLPIVLFGHSMGSMAAMHYVQRYHEPLAALVLSGTPGVGAPLQMFLSHTVARFERWRLGPTAESALMQRLLFGDANKEFEGSTGFEWLSRDTIEVKRYMDDPFCGFVLRAGSLCELFAASRAAAQPSAFAAIRKGMPVHVLVGSDDPVHAKQKNLTRLYARFEGAGVSPVTKRVYKSGRHEMLNETNRGDVINDIVKWLDGVTKG